MIPSKITWKEEKVWFLVAFDDITIIKELQRIANINRNDTLLYVNELRPVI